MTLWIATRIWLQRWKQVSSGHSKHTGFYKMAVQIWQPEKTIRLTNQVSGSKKFCTAWNWRLTLDTNLASRLAMAVHRQQTDLGRSSVLISTPFTLKGHNFCSRIFEITQIETLGIKRSSLALAVPKGKAHGKNMPPCFVCVCVHS